MISTLDDNLQLELLREASTAAKIAAGENVSIVAKLQSYRLWIIAEYIHEMATRGCKEAKGTVMTILGVIIQDPYITEICGMYYDPRLAPAGISAGTAPAHQGSPTQDSTSPNSSVRSMDHSSQEVPDRESFESKPSFRLPEEQESVLPFLLEVISSVAILEPIDENVACDGWIKVFGASVESTADGDVQLTGGRIEFGLEASLHVILAMGKYCSTSEGRDRWYEPLVDVVEGKWRQIKERLALDNFFMNMKGFQWDHKEGWPTEYDDGKGVKLNKRFGISTENERVVKVHLAGNKLEGEGSLVDAQGKIIVVSN